jgi:prevent-host-death family protein
MQVSVREARRQLSQLLQAVEHGEQVEITRRGRVVARIAPPEPPSPRLAEGRAAVRAELRASVPPSKASATALVRELRDERG